MLRNSKDYVVRIDDNEYYEYMKTGLRVIDGELYRNNDHNGYYRSYDHINREYIEMNQYTPMRRLLYLLMYNISEVFKTIALLEDDDTIGSREVEAKIPMDGGMVDIKGLTIFPYEE